MYKIETHCHTKESSGCGEVCAQRLVDLHWRAGYDGMVITDHFHASNARHLWPGAAYAEQVKGLFKGYEQAKKAAAGKLVVLPGLEIRFNLDNNDYLVYGMTEEQLLRHPDILEWGIEKFSKYGREQGLLIVHAHPFRTGMRIINPALVDMIEVYNGHPLHNSRNHLARYWAETYNISASSGSDCHREGDEGRGGVLLPRLPETIDEFIELMKAEPFLITN